MSSYSCSSTECVAKKKTQNSAKEPFIPLRLLFCGHSMCEICILQLCQQNKAFIKCTVCSFNTTTSEAVHKNVIQYESDINKWLDSTATAAQIMRLDINLFPLDMHQIGNAVNLGSITATKTAEMIDLDEDNTHNEDVVPYHPVNSLFEDDNIVKQIPHRIPKTCKKTFQESAESGVKTFTDLSTNHNSMKRLCDETKEWFKKSKTEVKEVFHKLHSILQMREKEVLDQMDKREDNRLKELKVLMNEILSKRSELKGKLLQCPQTQTDKDRSSLRKAIDQLVKDSNVMSINSPQNEFKISFNQTIEEQLKTLGVISKISPSVPECGDKAQDNSADETPISISSDEDDEDIEEVPKSDETMNKEVVNVLQMTTPNKFYVQKSSDKERFETLNNQIQQICRSAYNHAPAVETLPEGEHIFAYSLTQKCWCRASLTVFRSEPNPNTREIQYLADIVLIDYGITETVQWYNVREKKTELFDVRKYPPFAYKCSLYSVRPNKSSWSPEAIDLFRLYVTNNQLILFEFETNSDGYKYVDLIHYDVPEVTYQIPSIIEVLVKNDLAILTADIDFGGYCRQKTQTIAYKTPELPKNLRTLSVLVSHVETPDLFYVQLQRQHENLMNLLEELDSMYTKDNAGIYTYYCVRLNTPCAAIYEGDGKYYRALVVNKGKNCSEFVVQFVDFGSKQMVKVKYMRLLKDSLMELPIQAIPCGLIHVEPNYGFKWSKEAIDYFKLSISDERGPQILTMTVYESVKLNTSQQKLMVVLRSYDGDNGVKINEKMVEGRHAHSSGPHSQQDFKQNFSSQESVSSLDSSSSPRSVRTTLSSMPLKISALLVLKDLKERHELSGADKRSSLIKVKVTSVQNPSEFYVQIERQELIKYFEEMEKDLHKEYSSSKHQFLGDINFVSNDFCAFKVDDDWRRGRVLKRLDEVSIDAPPEEPKFLVSDMDYGSALELRVSRMRRLSNNYQMDGPFALNCKLSTLRPTGGDEWTHSAKDDFKEFVHKYSNDLYILVKGTVETEPISVMLYSKETTIPGAFAKQRTEYKSINTLFINQGLAIRDRTGSELSLTDEVKDDEEINSEITSATRPQMPFSLFSSQESVLDNLKQRFPENTSAQSGQHFDYLTEVYPNKQTFYGIPTDLKINEFEICFRLYIENVVSQPQQTIEKCIQDIISEKGELEPFTGSFTKGNACTAYFDFDKTWNRAEIVGVAKENESLHSKLVVRYVDYGNQESIIVDRLSGEVFGRDTPKLALKCHLIDIKPLNTESAEKIRTILYTQVLDHKCRFFWENYPKTPMKASLEIPIDGAFGDTYQPLISYLDNQNLLTTNRSEDNESVESVLEIQSLIDQTYGLYPIVFEPNSFYEVVVSYALVTNYGFFQVLEVKDPMRGDVTINGEHDDFLIMLQSMRTEVDRYPMVQNYREGHPCVAQDVDECWYRGLILTVNPKEKMAEIYFVDYGNTTSVLFTKLREIPKGYMKPKAHSILCQLFNIRPANNGMWSRNKELAETMFERLSQICINDTLWAKFKSLKYPLKIDLYLSDSEDQTQPGKHAFQEFVDRGMAEFIEARDVWKKPIKTTQSYRNVVNVKKEPNY